LYRKDAVEYANRVPREIFTKDVAKSYLTLNLYQLGKYFPEGKCCHFVIELPDVSPVNFYQTLGLVNAQHLTIS
jgi:hypothetical protein